MFAVMLVGWAPTAAMAGPRLPAAPLWGACGISTAESKIVHAFPRGVTLRCGGPVGSSNPSWGYRHMLKHRDALAAMAAPAGLNWRDLAHWAIYYAITDPDASVQTNNTICRSRYLFLENRDGRVYRKQIFKVVYNAQTGRIVTLTPTTSQCSR